MYYNYYHFAQQIQLVREIIELNEYVSSGY